MIDYDIAYLPKDDVILLEVDDEYIRIPRQHFLSDVFILLERGMPCEFKDKKGTTRWLTGMTE